MKTLLYGEVLEELSETQCALAVQRRREAIKDCVGWLYPSIIEGEIALLRERADLLHRHVPIQKEMF